MVSPLHCLCPPYACSNLGLQGLGGSAQTPSVLLRYLFSSRSAYIHNTFLAILVNFLWGRRHGLGLSVLQVLDVVVNEQYPVSTEVRVG